ncbi:hypothetical protein [Komagataeibacter kakiaceti]|nr:hypothetical protein [Komagataeibacter kakiaceti]
MRVPDDAPPCTVAPPEPTLSDYARQVRAGYRALLRRRVGILTLLAG